MALLWSNVLAGTSPTVALAVVGALILGLVLPYLIIRKGNFRETDRGEVTGEQIRPSGEMRGFATDTEADADKPATEILREKRNQDRDERETQLSTEE